jgi:hypothetical protein
MVTMQHVQKRLAAQGVKMEMGPVGQRDTKPSNKMVGIGQGSDRTEHIVVSVGERGEVHALVPSDQVEKYLKDHPGAKVLEEPPLEPGDTVGIAHELLVRGNAYVKRPDGS